MPTQPPSDESHPAMLPEPTPPGPMADTIASIVARSERRVGRHQRAMESLTAVMGTPPALYAVVGAVLSWVIVNSFLHALAPREVLDNPPFLWLQGVMNMASLVMTILILITANRQTRQSEERAHLDLQVNLLTEQKVAKLIALVEELRRDLPMVQDRVDPEAESMQVAVNPHALLEQLEKTTAAGPTQEAAKEAGATTPRSSE
jgi:uncharacterized membrane protein